MPGKGALRNVLIEKKAPLNRLQRQVRFQVRTWKRKTESVGHPETGTAMAVHLYSVLMPGYGGAAYAAR